MSTLANRPYFTELDFDEIECIEDLEICDVNVNCPHCKNKCTSFYKKTSPKPQTI